VLLLLVLLVVLVLCFGSQILQAGVSVVDDLLHRILRILQDMLAPPPEAAGRTQATTAILEPGGSQSNREEG